MAHQLFCHPAISQFLMADISLNIACKELKIALIAQLNLLFQLLHLVHIFYELSRMLMRKNVNNDVSKGLTLVVRVPEYSGRACTSAWTDPGIFRVSEYYCFTDG